MADKLLVRAYNVDVGDCIYCRIPKAIRRGASVEDFHILIDCGSKGSANLLATAIEHLKEFLPDAGGGKKRIDLLVATHEHEDHIKGMDPEVFADIKIDNIWMNVAMDENHPQAGQSRSLRGFAMREMRGLAEQNLSMSPELQELVALFGIDNDGAMEALRTTLPEANEIKPRYVHAGMTNDDLGIQLQDGVRITVLGPENDIDRFYLGADADASLRGLSAASKDFRERAAAVSAEVPANISAADFRLLQSRMLSNAFAFANLSSKVTNNTSVVLLIEWKGKRLLFVGDAEWDNKFKEGKSNGAWNTMWKERKELLDRPVDFLKVGHHGSENATPWLDGSETETEPSQILDAILPVPGRGVPKAKAVVSTARKNYKTIPRSELLAVIGQRVANVRNYSEALQAEDLDPRKLPRFGEFEEDFIDSPQPLRTDCELLLTKKSFVDVEFEA